MLTAVIHLSGIQPEFIKQLSEVLTNISNDNVARSAAGLQLKNALTSKDEEIRQQFQQRWLSLPEDVRVYVKRNVVSALGTEQQRPSAAAQCVAYIAVAELPHGLWPDVIHHLTANVTNPSRYCLHNLVSLAGHVLAFAFNLNYQL